MKIAVYYDSLVSRGGAERVVILLANNLRADIITSGFNPEIARWMPIKGRVVDIGNLSIKYFKPLGILFEAPIRYLLMKKKLEYDLHIYCGFTSIYGARQDMNNIWHCFTPNRIMYDLKESKRNEGSIFKRLALSLHCSLFSKRDKYIVKNCIKQIIVQSRTVQDRVRKYYGLDAKIINDPIDVNEYYFEEYDDFYLSVSRLFPEKRIELLVDSFIAMPNKKLTIVGDGPDKKKICQRLKNAPNISLLSNVNDQTLKKLYATCFATIYMPKNEDYGLIPLESNASGKICVAANEGGLKETIIDGKTGFLVTPTKDEIIRSVSRIDHNMVNSMRTSCVLHAKKFDIENCISKWNKEIFRYN